MIADNVSAAAAVVSTVLTGGALAFAYVQIRDVRRATQDERDREQRRDCRNRVDYYQERLTSAEFRPLVADAVRLFGTPHAQRAAAFADWSGGDLERQLDTLAFLNFFEEVAGQYRAGLLDRAAARRIIVPTATRYWESGGWFIDELRRNQPRAFSEWAEMVRDVGWEELRNRLGSR